MTDPPPKAEIVRLRLSADEKADWTAAAERAGLSLSGYVRRCVKETLDLERAVARADALAARRAEALHALDPPAARRRFERGGEA